MYLRILYSDEECCYSNLDYNSFWNFFRAGLQTIQNTKPIDINHMTPSWPLNKLSRIPSDLFRSSGLTNVRITFADDGCANQLNGENPFTMYIKSSHCALQISYNFVNYTLIKLKDKKENAQKNNNNSCWKQA